MTTETVTLIAACMAAIASISGVGLTAWLNRRSESLRWMRTEGRPLFARYLAASTTHIELMGDRAQIMNRILISQQAGGQGDPDDWTAKAANEQELLDAWKTLEALYAELQVSAPSQVVKAAHYLMASGHMQLRFTLRNGGAAFKLDAYNGLYPKVKALTEYYLAAVRKAVGVENLEPLESFGSLMGVVPDDIDDIVPSYKSMPSRAP